MFVSRTCRGHCTQKWRERERSSPRMIYDGKDNEANGDILSLVPIMYPCLLCTLDARSINMVYWSLSSCAVVLELKTLFDCKDTMNNCRDVLNIDGIESILTRMFSFNKREHHLHWSRWSKLCLCRNDRVKSNDARRMIIALHRLTTSTRMAFIFQLRHWWVRCACVREREREREKSNKIISLFLVDQWRLCDIVYRSCVHLLSHEQNIGQWCGREREREHPCRGLSPIIIMILLLSFVVSVTRLLNVNITNRHSVHTFLCVRCCALTGWFFLVDTYSLLLVFCVYIVKRHCHVSIALFLVRHQTNTSHTAMLNMTCIVLIHSWEQRRATSTSHLDA
jgi:hypothetical protein